MHAANRLAQLKENIDYFDAGTNAADLIDLIESTKLYLHANVRNTDVIKLAALHVHSSKYSLDIKRQVLECLKGSTA